MFIYERRRVIWSNRTGKYQRDRTFYVCSSKRVDGKPKRVVHGRFKNACSLADAVARQEQAIAEHLKNESLARGYGFLESWKDSHQRMIDFLETLRDWQKELPDWRADELGEITYQEIPKQKPRPPRPSTLVKRACDLVQQMDIDERQEFFHCLRDLER